MEKNIVSLIVETALKKEKIWDNQEKNFHIFWIKNVAKELSEYASTSYSETIGEAFAEYIDSKKPRAWAQAICKEIKHRLTSQ